MIRWPILSLLLLLIGAAAAGAQDQTFMDWYGPGDPAYRLLQQAASQAGRGGWAAGLLARNAPLPQASARDLAGELMDEPSLDPKLLEELAGAFPSEVELAKSSQARSQSTADTVEERLKRVQRGLDELEALRDKNTYYKGSSPTLRFGLRSKASASDWYRYLIRQQANMGAQAYWEWVGAAQGSSWRVRMEMRYKARDNDEGFYPSILGLSQGSQAGLLLDNDSISGLEINLGWQPVFFSTLIYSGASFWQAMPFFGGPAAPEIRLEAPAGNRETVGLYLRKTGKTRVWWPFHSAELALSPNKNMFKGYSGEKNWELAARLGLWGADLFLVRNATPFVAASLVAQNEANVNAFTAAGQAVEQPYHTRAFAFGAKGELWGGGSLDAEWAMSDWRRNDAQDTSWQDSATYATVSRNFGRLLLAFEGASIGPKYVTNTRGRSTGAPLDSSLELAVPGPLPAISYDTLSFSPSWLVNNTSRYGVQAAYKTFFGSIVAAASSSGQILPSGPFVQVIPWVGNMPFNGNDRYNLFGQDYYTPAPGASAPPTGYNPETFRYNRATELNYEHRGLSRLDRWDLLMQVDDYVRHRLLLASRDGSGTVTARPDSVKFFNGARLGLMLDFRALFELELPANFSAYGELRDTDESGGLAKWNGGLVSQRVGEASLSLGLSPEVTWLLMAGYESLESRATPNPLEGSDWAAGTGFNFSLTRLISGSFAELRYRILRHHDSMQEDRSFNGWVFSAVTGIDY